MLNLSSKSFLFLLGTCLMIKISFAQVNSSTYGDSNQRNILKAYPVPFNDVLIINGLKEEQEVVLFDLNGRKVLSEKTNGRLTTDFLPNGVYMVKAQGYRPFTVIKNGDTAPLQVLTSTRFNASSQFTLDLFPSGRNKVIFDSKAGLGLNESEIKFTGTGTPGTTVQYRIRNADNNNIIFGWANFATVSANGQWSGFVRKSRRVPWLKAEFRQTNNPQDIRESRLFAIGHCIARFSQSDEYHIYRVGFNENTGQWNSQVARADVDNDEVLQLVFMPRSEGDAVKPAGSAFWIRVGGNNLAPAGFATMSNAYNKMFGGIKVSIALHSESGTGLFEMLNDNDNDRHFADDMQIRNLFTEDGQVPSMQSHFFSSGTSIYNDTFRTIPMALFGIDRNGNALDLSTTSSFRNGKIDYTVSELYDPMKTRMSFLAQNGELVNDLEQELNTYYDGFITERAASKMSIGGFLKGEPNNAGTFFNDTNHPAFNDLDGGPRLAEMLVKDHAYQAGLIGNDDWGYHHVTDVEWHPNNDKKAVKVSSIHGEVTTMNLINGRSRITEAEANGRPWVMADVRGFIVNGEPAYRTFIKDSNGNLSDRGDIYIYKNDGSDFTADDNLVFDMSQWPPRENPVDFFNRTTYGNVVRFIDPDIRARPTGRFSVPGPELFANPLGGGPVNGPELPVSWTFIDNSGSNKNKRLSQTQDIDASGQFHELRVADNSWTGNFVQWKIVPVPGSNKYYYILGRGADRYIQATAISETIGGVDGFATRLVPTSKDWYQTQWELIHLGNGQYVDF